MSMRTMIAVAVLCVATAAGAAEPIPAFILGQNVEHTRSAVQGGLSAQLVRNRKFAGKDFRDVIGDLKLVIMTYQSFNTGRLDEREKEITSIFSAMREARNKSAKVNA